MSRARSVPSVLIFVVAFAIAVPAWAAYDAFITGITDGTISARKAGGEQVSLRVQDPAALGRLAVGQKITVDEATGKASMQDFHFVVKVDKATPMLRTAAPLGTPAASKQVMINGKLLSTNGRLIGGKVFVPLEDFSRALGGNGITLDSSLKLEFPRLLSVGGAQGNTAIKGESSAQKVFPKVESPSQKVFPKVESPAQKVAPSPAAKIESTGYLKMGDGSVRGLRLLSLNKGGVVSSQLQKIDGKVFVPLADILIGLGQDPSRINANAMSLNFTVPAVQGTLISSH